MKKDVFSLIHILSMMLLIPMTGCSLINVTQVPDNPPAPADEPVEVTPVPLEYSVLHKADYNIDDRETFKAFTVLASAAEYQSELALYSVEVPKPVDFASQRVILLAMGTQPSGGYAVGIKSALEFPDEILVTVYLRSPGPACITTEALSNPYEFAVLDAVKPITFEEAPVQQQCE